MNDYNSQIGQDAGKIPDKDVAMHINNHRWFGEPYLASFREELSEILFHSQSMWSVRVYAPVLDFIQKSVTIPFYMACSLQVMRKLEGGFWDPC